jgi:hypothetical protein
MRNLAIGFIGVALTMALVAPACAKAPATSAPTTVAMRSTMAGKNICATRHKKTHRGSGTSSDNQANMLNSQELSRLQGGGPAPPPPR